jgi:adenosylcobyric acid synthase
MVLGTSSHVGKSLLTAALCRIAAQAGYRVAPFKSQNMSLNSAVTPEGLEIGRAQALQAEAAGIPPSVHMNPILLKPGGDMTSQVVVHGRIWGKLSAADYHLRRVHELLPLIRESYETLAAQYQLIVLEGAGSPAEINLKPHDIVNMRMAAMADATCILVGDIDRGGVFASLLGTIELLEPAEQARIAGFVINKFRGDQKLLEPGIRMIEERLHKPCLGIVPFLPGLALEEEDSLGLRPLHAGAGAGWAESSEPSRPLRIAVLALPSLSNFTDLDALQAEPSVALRLCTTPEQLVGADLVLLPGSKQTSADLGWIRSRGLDIALTRFAATGLIVGICGGMQMLGRTILDPHNVEGGGLVEGLNLLPFETTMQPIKTTRLSRGCLLSHSLFGQPIAAIHLQGYEVHVGETLYSEAATAFAELTASGTASAFLDGCVSRDGRTLGTYLHGLFDDDAFRHGFLQAARAASGLMPPQRLTDWKTAREASLDRLAEAVRSSLDLPRIFSWVGLADPPAAPGGDHGS